MSLTPLLDVLVTDPMVQRIVGAPVGSGQGAAEVLDIAVCAGARPSLIAALAGASPGIRDGLGRRHDPVAVPAAELDLVGRMPVAGEVLWAGRRVDGRDRRRVLASCPLAEDERVGVEVA